MEYEIRNCRIVKINGVVVMRLDHSADPDEETAQLCAFAIKPKDFRAWAQAFADLAEQYEVICDASREFIDDMSAEEIEEALELKGGCITPLGRNGIPSADPIFGGYTCVANVLHREDTDEWVVSKHNITYWIQPVKNRYAVTGSDGRAANFHSLFFALVYCFSGEIVGGGNSNDSNEKYAAGGNSNDSTEQYAGLNPKAICCQQDGCFRQADATGYCKHHTEAL